MTIEEYQPRKGGTKYRRRREYKMVDGKRVVKYVEYLGRAGAKPSNNTSTTTTTTTLAESESKIREYNIELGKLGDSASQELKKRASDEYVRRDELLMQGVAEQKGKPLTKIETGLYKKYNPSTYAQLDNFVKMSVDKQYQAGAGLLVIRRELHADEVDVSTTTIKKHLVDAGIYEKRPFGHERKVRSREAELEERLREAERAKEQAIFDREKLITKVTDENEKLRKELERAQRIAKM